MSIEFLVTALIVVLLPGTGVIYTLAVGLGRGLRPSIAAAFGCTLGIVPHAVASIVGLAAVLHASAVAFQVVKILGVLYLFYMAWRILRDGGALDVDADRRCAGVLRLVRDGILLNVLNPKLSLFFLAFLPQFVKPENGSVLVQLSLLGVLFVLLGLSSTVVFAVGAGGLGRFLRRNPAVLRWQGKVVGGIYCALGLRLALQER